MANKKTKSQHGSGAQPDSAWKIFVGDLVGNAGDSREESFTAPAPSDLGNAMMEVPEGQPVKVTARLDAVHEGVLFSGTITAELKGECSRCLTPMQEDVDLNVHELFSVEVDPLVEEEEEQRLIEHDTIDIEPTVREALVSSIPFQPLCHPDCSGLCDQCGIRLEDAPEDHYHEQLDPRWAALAQLSSSADDEGENQKPVSNKEER